MSFASRQLTVALLGSLALGAAGCGSGSSKPSTQTVSHRDPAAQRLLSAAATLTLQSRAAFGRQLHIRMIQRVSGFMNAGAPHGFALIVPSETSFAIAPNSSAHVSARFTSHWYFASSLARRQWQLEGKPSLPRMQTKTRSATTRPGSYSFLPVGPKLTYTKAQRLPTSPASVRRTVEAYLQSFNSQDRPAMMLRSFGYLLAAAPVSAKTRAAIYEAMASLPGIRVSESGRDLLGRHGVWLVMDSSDEWVEVLLDPKRATVLAVQERVRKPQSIFPSLSLGDPIEATAFVSRS